MGGKPTTSSRLPRQVRQIKELNQHFQALVEHGASEAQLDKIRDQKEALLEEMYAECDHGDVVRYVAGMVVRVCLQCGYSPPYGDQRAEEAFSKFPAREVTREEYKLLVGQALIRLGINIH